MKTIKNQYTVILIIEKSIIDYLSLFDGLVVNIVNCVVNPWLTICVLITKSKSKFYFLK